MPAFCYSFLHSTRTFLMVCLCCCIPHHEHHRTKLEWGTRVILSRGGIFFWIVKNRASLTVTERERVPVSKRHMPVYDLKSPPSLRHDPKNVIHSIPLPPYPAASIHPSIQCTPKQGPENKSFCFLCCSMILSLTQLVFYRLLSTPLCIFYLQGRTTDIKKQGNDSFAS